MYLELEGRGIIMEVTRPLPLSTQIFWPPVYFLRLKYRLTNILAASVHTYK